MRAAASSSSLVVKASSRRRLLVSPNHHQQRAVQETVGGGDYVGCIRSSRGNSISRIRTIGAAVPCHTAATATAIAAARTMDSSMFVRSLSSSFPQEEAVHHPQMDSESTNNSDASTSSSSSSSTSSALPPPLATPRKVGVVSKEDEHQEETKRRRLSEVPISEVLTAKHSYRWVEPVINRKSRIKEAIVTAIEGGLSGMMVLEDPVQQGGDDENNNKRKVVGLLTSRDLLRIMAKGIKEGETADGMLNHYVGDFMTPISQVIFGRPDETVGIARTLMAKLGIKCLPILSRDGRVEGLITARDMSDFGLSAKDKGGKKSYLTDVSERVGLSSDTSMAEPPIYLKAHLALQQAQAPLFVNLGVSALPHPFKTADGCGRRQRDLGLQDISTDPELSEDAHFLTDVILPDEKDQSLRKFTFMGVADGVGSWREYGVDPRAFSKRLMEECENILQEACSGLAGGSHQKEVDGGQKFRQVLAPAEILAQAYERVKAADIIGSCTACVGLFDSMRHQLHFSNLGDSGIIVLRHIDSDVAGTLKRSKTPRTDRKSDLRVAFVSQQQLLSFNHPFQLGWTGDEISSQESRSFKKAQEACTSSLHVRRGDIIIMATDGLFDNVDVDEICSIALEWEQTNGFIRGGDIIQRERRWAMGNSLTVLSSETISGLSDILVEKARANSLDHSLDSPFAILAKENDIMWSGGMPDDTTVVAMHVVGRDVDDVMDSTNM